MKWNKLRKKKKQNEIKIGLSGFGGRPLLVACS